MLPSPPCSMQAEITELLAAIKSEEQEVQALCHQVKSPIGCYMVWSLRRTHLIRRV